jgi:4-amino-4-deoxy-L-arabinose transferase-like glycosyltransferase
VIAAPQRRHSLYILVAVLALYLVLAGLTAFAEHIWSNEAWFASPALTLIHKVYLGTTILESRGTWLEGIDRHTYWIPPLHPLMQALWYRLLGFNLLTLRWLSIAAGAALLLAWYSIVSRLAESRWIALLAAAIAANRAQLEDLILDWPHDIRTYIQRRVEDAFRADDGSPTTGSSCQ